MILPFGKVYVKCLSCSKKIVIEFSLIERIFFSLYFFVSLTFSMHNNTFMKKKIKSQKEVSTKMKVSSERKLPFTVTLGNDFRAYVLSGRVARPNTFPRVFKVILRVVDVRNAKLCAV